MISAYLLVYRNGAGVQSPITPLLPPAGLRLEISVYEIGSEGWKPDA